MHVKFLTFKLKAKYHFSRTKQRQVHIDRTLLWSFKPQYTKLVTNKSRSFLERIYNPIMAMGFWQCLPFSWTTLIGKHCRHPIAVMGDVDTFRRCLSSLLCYKQTRVPPPSDMIVPHCFKRKTFIFHIFSPCGMNTAPQAPNV